MPYIPRDQLERVRKIDLLTYLLSHEPDELVKVSPAVYSIRTHDSLKISNGLWIQWSTGIGGRSALDFLIKIRGMTLPEAVITIESTAVFRTAAQPSFSYSKKQRERVFELPQKSRDSSAIISYLAGRNIDREIIRELISVGLIYEQRDFHNVVFVGLDKEGTPRHASIRATNTSRYMRDAAGSDKRYSFSYITDDQNASLHVFESAIDLLSYCTLVKLNGGDWRDGNYLSLSGVSKDAKTDRLPAALERVLKDQPKINQIYLHLDNDEAGRNASQSIISSLPDGVSATDAPPPEGKDINEFLSIKTERKIQNERTKHYSRCSR